MGLMAIFINHKSADNRGESSIQLEYNADTLELNKLTWSQGDSKEFSLTIWNGGSDIYNETKTSSSGSEDLSLGITLEEVIEDDMTEITFPNNIFYKLNIQ